LPRPIVLDSSAILSVFLSEPGSERVIPILNGALLSTVNLAEVITRMIDVGAGAEHVRNRVDTVRCEVCDFTDQQAFTAAKLRSITRPFGLSPGDRACLALAMDRKATVYTTDRVWKNLDLGIVIEVIR
jgi:PIN domain nuclease of toxin-antitoxin system